MMITRTFKGDWRAYLKITPRVHMHVRNNFPGLAGSKTFPDYIELIFKDELPPDDQKLRAFMENFMLPPLISYKDQFKAATTVAEKITIIAKHLKLQD